MIPNVNIEANVKRILSSDKTDLILVGSIFINAVVAIILFLSGLISNIHNLLPDIVFTIGGFVILPVILYFLKGAAFDLYMIIMQYYMLHKKYEKEDEEE